MRRKASKASKVRTKASKVEDEGGFEGFEREDEGRQGFEGDNWNVTEHAASRSCQAANLFFKPNESYPGQLVCQACRTKRGKPHGNVLSGRKTEENEKRT